MKISTKLFISALIIVIFILAGYVYQTKIDRTNTIYSDIDSSGLYMIFKCNDGEIQVVPKPEEVNSAKEQQNFIDQHCSSLRE